MKTSYPPRLLAVLAWVSIASVSAEFCAAQEHPFVKFPPLPEPPAVKLTRVPSDPRVMGLSLKANLALLEESLKSLRAAALPPDAAGRPDAEWDRYAEAATKAQRAFTDATCRVRLIKGARDLRASGQKSGVIDRFNKDMKSEKKPYRPGGDGFWKLVRQLEALTRKMGQGEVVDIASTKPMEDKTFLAVMQVLTVENGAPAVDFGEDEKKDPFIGECAQITREVLDGEDCPEPDPAAAVEISGHLAALASRYEKSPSDLRFAIVASLAELKRIAGSNAGCTDCLDRLVPLFPNQPPEQASEMLYALAGNYRKLEARPVAEHLYVTADKTAPDTLTGYASRLELLLLRNSNNEKRNPRDEVKNTFEGKWKGPILHPLYESVAGLCLRWDDFAEALPIYRVLESDPSYPWRDWAQLRVMYMTKHVSGKDAAKAEYDKMIEKYPDSQFKGNAEGFIKRP